MNKATIEIALGNALTSEPTISFAELAAMPYIKIAEHDYITEQVEKKTVAHLRQFTLVAACCLLVFVSMSGWYLQNRITSSTITLDVNPSIQITTNHKDRVLSVQALNEDAQVIIGDSDYRDTKLEEIVVILMNSLVDQKYLDQEKNTILLSVKNKNAKKADAIMMEVDATIRENLVAQNITPVIMRQIITKEEEQNNLASNYHITMGKLNLIQNMISLNNKFTLDMLANMSIEQLLKLAEENSMDLSGYLSIDEDGVTPSMENAEDLLETAPSEENEEQSEDNEDQGEDNEEQDEDNEEQGEDNEEQGEDSEEQGEDNEEQDEDNEEHSTDYQEDENNSGNEDSDSQEKDVEDNNEVKDNNEDNDYSDRNNIELDEEEEFSNGEGDEGDIEDDINEKGNEQSDSGTTVSESEDEDGDQEVDRDKSNNLNEDEDSDNRENEDDEDSSENN